jgi:hypothetical protein
MFVLGARAHAAASGLPSDHRRGEEIASEMPVAQETFLRPETGVLRTGHRSEIQASRTFVQILTISLKALILKRETAESSLAKGTLT